MLGLTRLRLAESLRQRGHLAINEKISQTEGQIGELLVGIGNLPVVEINSVISPRMLLLTQTRPKTFPCCAKSPSACVFNRRVRISSPLGC